jgi:hypothetical protein
MSSFNKQLAVNQIGLPREIIRIIKDYTFMDTVMSNSKQNKNMIMDLIKTTTWCGRASPEVLDEGFLMFWLDEIDSLQFQIKFCKKCGDYINLSTNNEDIQNNIMCNCHH